MKNIINRKTAVLTLSLIASSSISASCALLSAPKLELRTLRLSKDIAGFEYQYEVCIKKFLGICTKKEIKKDLYDLNDLAIRKQLIDMGFVARVREKQ